MPNMEQVNSEQGVQPGTDEQRQLWEQYQTATEAQQHLETQYHQAKLDCDAQFKQTIGDALQDQIAQTTQQLDQYDEQFIQLFSPCQVGAIVRLVRIETQPEEVYAYLFRSIKPYDQDLFYCTRITSRCVDRYPAEEDVAPLKQTVHEITLVLRRIHLNGKLAQKRTRLEATVQMLKDGQMQYTWQQQYQPKIAKDLTKVEQRQCQKLQAMLLSTALQGG